jgi:hypothetical protein
MEIPKEQILQMLRDRGPGELLGRVGGKLGL